MRKNHFFRENKKVPACPGPDHPSKPASQKKITTIDNTPEIPETSQNTSLVISNGILNEEEQP